MLSAEFIPLAAVVLLGAVMQRVAGMGFALVVAPFTVLLFGPLQGVVIVNACGVVCAATLWAITRERIDRRRLLRLALLTPVGAAAGVGVLMIVDPAALYLVIGVTVLVALAATLGLQRVAYILPDGWTTTSLTGLATGALVSISGVGGPPLTAYALLTRWEQRSFAATMQPLTVIISSIALIAGVLVPGAAPELSVVEVTVLLASIGIGSAIAVPVGGLVSARVARVLVIVVAALGAVSILVRGVMAFAGG
ncbi:hypothetical protein FM104_11500 [Microbacterium esteraromaticum]|uniref:Probable membrane transporter protein n=1 Tax=Microbacterium esteraromaticum TaxID=57043 RepID=A0A1R4KBC5_9MICO|nr:TSUP family transporter [Microbacterium esteraromaticum]SJN41597.1 hypothetical protein FM104_11500 [Microbacterium esteraromaticum]